MTSYDTIIIGGGAAGLFCGIEAGKRAQKVLVIEHSERIGRKISISGGGRCNFTNIYSSPENFVSGNPHFCKSALARYTPADFISLVERHRIRYHEKKLGQLFCDDGSRQIIEMLLSESQQAGIEIRCGCEVLSVEKRDSFVVRTNQGDVSSSSLVIASGGLSIPKLGATDFGYRIARQFGLKIEDTRPALVPFLLGPKARARFGDLSGISLDVTVECCGKSFSEPLLITHRGLSGPAILQISTYWKPNEVISINLLPDHNALELLKENHLSSIELANFLSHYLPKRFAHAWCQGNVNSKPLHQYQKRDLEEIAEKLHHMLVIPSGTEGFGKAEVTAGGVSTAELSSQTMAARKVPGLYFIGEVVDVTGQLGGHNFQWAWASAFAAGQVVGVTPGTDRCQ
jgi:hypothetical protein